MNDPELREWPDCPKWARASEAPGWLIVAIYGGGLISLMIGLLSQGRFHTLFEPPELGSKIGMLAWGIIALAGGIWLIVTVRRARRIMTRITARRSEES
jgi:hypothetical protein